MVNCVTKVEFFFRFFLYMNKILSYQKKKYPPKSTIHLTDSTYCNLFVKPIRNNNIFLQRKNRVHISHILLSL